MPVALRAALAPLRPPGAPVISVDAALHTLHAPRPASLRELVSMLDPVRLSFPLNDGTCAGSCELVVSHDGHVTYTGHVHNSGALDARYIAITSVPVTFGPLLVAHQSTAGGTLGLDPRDDDWHVDGDSPLVAGDWHGFRQAVASAKTVFGANTGATEILTSFLGAGTGVWLFTL
jgi:hypothetical protein